MNILDEVNKLHEMDLLKRVTYNKYTSFQPIYALITFTDISNKHNIQRSIEE